MKELNRIYLETPAFWALDYDREGFRWVDCHEEEKCVYAFLRTDGKQELLALFNFSEKEHKDFPLLLNPEGEEKKDGAKREEGGYTLCLSSNWDIYGGTGEAGKERGKAHSYRERDAGNRSSCLRRAVSDADGGLLTRDKNGKNGKRKGPLRIYGSGPFLFQSL